MCRSASILARRARLISCTCLLFPFLTVCAQAQESDFGLAVPITLTGEAFYSHRLQEENPDASPLAAAFRAVFYPSVKLGPHWFGYAAIQVHRTPFFYEEAYESEREVETNVLQAFIGYSWSRERKSFTVKAGQLATAFGSFPLRYDDGLNPLLDNPLSYGYYYKPVSLYGIPGFELDASIYRWDTRFQLTNSSPSNPQSLGSGNQHPQWAAGGGYTIRQGLRIGLSAHRGPYLLRENLPADSWYRAGEFPSTGFGTDFQWARGRWNVAGELQRFQFARPGALTTIGKYGYGEIKVILTPRLYAAARFGFRREDFRPNLQTAELALGFRPNRFQLIKVGYLWLRGQDVEGSEYDVLGIQYVTSFQAVSKAFR